jgi:phosphopantetheinyl transferase (holo-ACP synthase)
LLFSHWGKPVFTILVSPFAQEGKNFARLFNVIVGLLTALFSWKLANTLEFKNSSEHFAGKFAIKEAVRKSIKEKIPFNKILTTHKNSKPRIILKMKLNYEFLVSVSHETNMALAIVIALKK